MQHIDSTKEKLVKVEKILEEAQPQTSEDFRLFGEIKKQMKKASNILIKTEKELKIRSDIKKNLVNMFDVEKKKL